MRKKAYIMTIAMAAAMMLTACGNEKPKETSVTNNTVAEADSSTPSNDNDEPIIIEKKETRTETKEESTDAIKVDDKGELVVDTDSKDVKIEKAADGTEIATIKTDDGEVKVAVKTDDKGNVTVDNTKTVETDKETGKTAVVTTAPNNDEKPASGQSTTTVEVDDKGKVVIKTTETTTVTVTVTATPTAKPTAAPTIEAGPTKAAVKATDTPTPTNTKAPAKTTDTPAPTNTAKPVSTNTPVPTSTNTPVPTSTNTPKPTATNTPRPTATNTPVPTNTSTPTPTVHVHNWTAQTKTVHHDEVGHWEKQETEWEEKIYYTGYCANTRPVKSVYELMKEEGTWSEDAWESITVTKEYWDDENGYYDTHINVGKISSWSKYAKDLLDDYCGSSTKEYHLYVESIYHTDTKDVWIVDKAAYDETVITGYTCSCGATK